MVYNVKTTRRAENDIYEIGEYIATELHAPESAGKLVDDIESQISDLNHMPKRFALVSNEKLASRGLRSIPVKNYLMADYCVFAEPRCRGFRRSSLPAHRKIR